MTIFIAVMVGFWSGRLFDAWLKHRDFPLKWRCKAPGCKFSTRTNDRETLEKIKQGHLEYHGL